MSFSADDIAGMLCEYESDLHTGMCRIVEESIEKEFANTKREAALNLLKCVKLSHEKISTILNIDISIVDEF